MGSDESASKYEHRLVSAAHHDRSDNAAGILLPLMWTVATRDDIRSEANERSGGVDDPEHMLSTTD